MNHSVVVGRLCTAVMTRGAVSVWVADVGHDVSSAGVPDSVTTRSYLLISVSSSRHTAAYAVDQMGGTHLIHSVKVGGGRGLQAR